MSADPWPFDSDSKFLCVLMWCSWTERRLFSDGDDAGDEIRRLHAQSAHMRQHLEYELEWLAGPESEAVTFRESRRERILRILEDWPSSGT